MNFTHQPFQVWFQNRRMKDKRQKMTLTWPCGDPVLAAYVLQQAAAATGMQLGPASPGPAGYPGGLIAAAAAAAAAAAVSSSPFGPMMAPRPPGLPPPPPFVSPISSSSNMPHRPTPSLLAPHLHTQHPNPHSHYLPGGTGLSPHSPPTEGGGIAGSAFSPATPPASCDSSSNANLGQISPQTTTKIDHPLVTSMKKESSHDLVGGGRRNIESQKGNVKDIKKDHERGILDDKRQSFNSLKSFDRMKRKRGSSSGSSSISSPPHSPPEHCIGLSPSSTKQSSNISSSSPLRIRRKASSPSSLEDLDGLYMVKSQQNNKNNITAKDTELSPNGMEFDNDDLMSSKTKSIFNFSTEENDFCNPNKKKDLCIKEEQLNCKTKSLKRIDSSSVSPSTTASNPASSASTSASLFQPYLDIEKK